MAKKKFKLDEQEWLKITNALRKPMSGGVQLVDKVMQTSSVCPICNTEAWIGKDEKEVAPLVVDKDTLHFFSRCCSIQGGPINYLMIVHRISAEKAMKKLRTICRKG